MHPFPSLQCAGSAPPIVTLSPATVSGSRTGPGACSTSSVTATVVGGVAPYTYAWTPQAGVTANAPTSATSSFTATVGSRTTLNAVATLVVTDAIGQQASAQVNLAFTANAVPPTIAVSGNSPQNRVGPGASPALVFNAAITAMNDAGGVSSWGYQVIETGVGTIINGSGASATFGLSLSAGQTRSGYVQFFAYCQTGVYGSAQAPWSTTAT